MYYYYFQYYIISLSISNNIILLFILTNSTTAASNTSSYFYTSPIPIIHNTIISSCPSPTFPYLCLFLLYVPRKHKEANEGLKDHRYIISGFCLYLCTVCSQGYISNLNSIKGRRKKHKIYTVSICCMEHNNKLIR